MLYCLPLIKVRLYMVLQTAGAGKCNLSAARAHCNARGLHVLLYFPYSHLLPVKNSGGERSRCLSGCKNLGEVLGAAGTTAGNDRDADGVRDGPHQL